ncbi:MAG: RtcB family protein [bacterium]|nr:RtcB family protein [bacterium]
MLQRIDPYRVKVPREGGMHRDALIYANEAITIEEEALRQLRNAASLDPEAIVLATPDIHSGYGVPIGCVLATPNFISPCAVGYDINCGMRMLTTPLRRGEVDISAIAQSIRRDIPLGEGKHNVSVSQKQLDAVLEKGLAAVPEIVGAHARLEEAFDEEEFARDVICAEDQGSMKGDPDAVSRHAKERGRDQLGTLGGGNHFIEIQVVDEVYDSERAKAFGLWRGQITFMIHSGSRGLGHQVADDYMRSARQWIEKQGIFVPDRDLAYFGVQTKQGRDYIGAMQAAANFAFVNRYVMAELIRRNVRHYYGKELAMPCLYDVPHNIAKLEEHGGVRYWVHRKGATRAFPGELMEGTEYVGTGQPVLIPGSMGTASYVLAGTRSGEEALYSVNHGAGRKMSRTAASGVGRHGAKHEAAISDEEFRRSMEGVLLLCEDRRTIKAEAPGAYKDIDDVIAVVSGAGLALPVARLRPLAVLKG